jgi:hypothetical protein
VLAIKPAMNNGIFTRLTHPLVQRQSLLSIANVIKHRHGFGLVNNHGAANDGRFLVLFSESSLSRFGGYALLSGDFESARQYAMSSDLALRRSKLAIIEKQAAP